MTFLFQSALKSAILTHFEARGFNGHLNIRNSTLTSCQKCSYLHQPPHYRMKEKQQWHRKATLYSLNTIVTNVMYIDRVDDHAYSM